MNTIHRCTFCLHEIVPTIVVLYRLVVCMVVLGSLVSCDITPVKPEQVFTVYRERMNAQRDQEARKLLSPDSLTLVKQIAQQYKLGQAPEKVALLNVLDPVSIPTVMKVDKDVALLQVRTLKGNTRLIRLTRPTPNSGWKIDITDELRSLENFLEAKEALSGLQQQAGEFAASWKAFDDKLEKMGGPEPEPKPPVKEVAKKPVKPKRSPKRSKTQEKSQKNHTR